MVGPMAKMEFGVGRGLRKAGIWNLLTTRMTRKPERDSRLRVSEEIVRQVQSWIRQGELKPGGQLPPERRLAGLFRASRG